MPFLPPENGPIPPDAAPLAVRDAVIIAAGYGSRLQALSSSKPLTPVCGMTLIEIGVRQLALAGVERVIVVTGHEADRLTAALPDIALRTGVAIETAHVDDWSRPNGWSVMAGAAKIAGDYLLVMADHILSADILIALAQGHQAGMAVMLATDSRLESDLIDPDDATYVRCDRAGRIIAIGKHMDQPQAVDCGAFYATPALAEAIAAAIAAGRAGSLSDGMQILADQRRAATLDIGDAWWIDVDDPAAHDRATRDLPAHLPHVLVAA